ncbi:AbiH family protein [Klebsiella pneumoniae]
MRLYVIGNGFDIRHGLPTRFCCFEAYVKRHNQQLYESISNFVPTEDEWNDLESALGVSLDIENYCTSRSIIDHH